jgi:hypothetical protein
MAAPGHYIARTACFEVFQGLEVSELLDGMSQNDMEMGTSTGHGDADVDMLYL